ncbi:MAG: TonB-dependent siderophore receptor [Steroidobacteraceae bacterium]
MFKRSTAKSLKYSAIALFLGLSSTAQAQSTGDDDAQLETILITAQREARTSKGATGLPLEIKETPQTISVIDAEDIENFGATGSNDALRLGTGINVEQYETNRATYNARGFDVMLTQVDGLGMTNDWGTVEGQLDTYLFEKIELIRGANGLLTGVGNASGTINYVRKRPKNEDGGEIELSAGAYGLTRDALDYNKVFTESGSWAGRLVVAREDKDSYLRALHDKRTSAYGVVDGQIGAEGVLTLGFTYQDAKQRSPMWGSLTLPYADGTLADFPRSASPSQDWTRWTNRSYNAFVEYTQQLFGDWQAKFTYNHVRGESSTKLFYAYTFTGYLNDDNTGLYGWPYRSEGESTSNIFDVNFAGHFDAFGRQHEAVIGLSHSRQTNFSEYYSIISAPSSVLPAFPYAGDVYAEPVWGDRLVGADGNQKITRAYGAARLALTDSLKGIIGFNAIKLQRDGTSIYGGGVALDNETTDEVSPYVGVTYDITPNVLAYASYSDIFQAQDQRNINGEFLAPMKGVNAEIGAKAEWFDRKLLTTASVFSAQQKGLATEAGFDVVAQQSYYEPKDVKSRGFEIEATGRLTTNTKLTVGYTQLHLTGPDGKDIYEWIPEKTLNLRVDTRLPALPKLRLGAALRWQSDVSKIGGAWQDAYAVANGFTSYALTDKATLRLNVDNLTDKKYVKTVAYGAIYGAPRTTSLSFEYKL